MTEATLTQEPHLADAASRRPDPACRFCGTTLSETFVDLGASPLCESFLTATDLGEMEPFYPLKAYVCSQCFLVQVPAHVSGEAIFSHYAYFSSYSDSWLAHAARYADMITDRLALNARSLVVEIASNDGYLLKNFVGKGIPVMGVEPAANVAAVAVEQGIPSVVKFFGRRTAQGLVDSGVRPNLLIGNNVLAHVPDINDFVGGLQILLADDGVISMEFPHLMRLVEGNQFDTIYQEHYSYLSLLTVEQIFKAHGLAIVDVEELPTHGGSIRIYARHAASQPAITAAVASMRRREQTAGYDQLAVYRAFAQRVVDTKHKLLAFLIEAKRAGKRIAGYGAPGKGNTLLNYCGIREDFIDYVVDRNPFKHGKYLPGSHIPVYSPERIAETRPDYVLILPWNLTDEVVAQLAYVREWGGRFVIPIPEVSILD